MTEARGAERGPDRQWRVGAFALAVLAFTIVPWMAAFPRDDRLDLVTFAQKASFFLVAAIAYPAIAAFGDRVLLIGWLLFSESLLLQACGEFTLEPRFWGVTFTFALGATGILLAGIGLWRASRRRLREHRAQQLAAAELELSHATLAAVMDGTPDLVSVRDLDGRYMMINTALAHAIGLPAAQIVGRTDAQILPSGAGALSERDRQVLETGDTATYEESAVGEGGPRTLLVTTGVFRDHRGFAAGLLRVSRDITDRKQVEAQLIHEALHDGLTGLPNRSRFLDALADAFARRRRRPEYLFAVLFLDLDRFKVINDSLGHATGDDVLAVFARAVKRWLRPTDIFARLGGDEFTILLDGMERIEDATRVAERIVEGLQTPLAVGSGDVYVSTSIGIAISTSGYERPEEIVRDADLALYRAKSSGRGRYAVFDVEMHVRAMALLQLESDLRRAVERHEFRLAYQPVVAMHSGQIIGFEALLRWQHPTRGPLAPGQFLETADECGVMVPIGRWCLREACAQLRRWQDTQPAAEHLTVSLNVTRRQLMHPHLVADVREALDASSLAPGRLRIEISENILTEHADVATERLAELSALGVRLDMDDFGMGYASLSYLQRFPFDALKMDPSFTDRMRGGENAEIVRAILTLGRSLGLDVVAKGVETGGPNALLRDMGCACAQGFLYSRPITADEATELIKGGLPVQQP